MLLGVFILIEFGCASELNDRYERKLKHSLKYSQCYVGQSGSNCKNIDNKIQKSQTKPELVNNISNSSGNSTLTDNLHKEKMKKYH